MQLTLLLMRKHIKEASDASSRLRMKNTIPFIIQIPELCVHRNSAKVSIWRAIGTFILHGRCESRTGTCIWAWHLGEEESTGRQGPEGQEAERLPQALVAQPTADTLCLRHACRQAPRYQQRVSKLCKNSTESLKGEFYSSAPKRRSLVHVPHPDRKRQCRSDVHITL